MINKTYRRDQGTYGDEFGLPRGCWSTTPPTTPRRSAWGCVSTTELVEKYKDRPFALLGVDCNEKQEAARNTMAAERMTWPQWHDGDRGDGPIVNSYHVRGYPTILVIDAQGIIRQGNVRGEAFDEAVATLMKGR